MQKITYSVPGIVLGHEEAGKERNTLETLKIQESFDVDQEAVRRVSFSRYFGQLFVRLIGLLILLGCSHLLEVHVGDIKMSKLTLAQQQLETAIGLFVSRRDRISAISLAGAADGILHGLVLKAGKQPFSDYAMGVREAMSGQTPARAKFAKHINDHLNINDLKHMDEGGSEEINFDPDISALGAILKAIANHHQLIPEHPDFIKAMLQWTWMFYDGEKITENEPYMKPAGEKLMSRYVERPDEIKKMEARFAKRYQEVTNNVEK